MTGAITLNSLSLRGSGGIQSAVIGPILLWPPRVLYWETLTYSTVLLLLLLLQRSLASAGTLPLTLTVCLSQVEKFYDQPLGVSKYFFYLTPFCFYASYCRLASIRPVVGAFHLKKIVNSNAVLYLFFFRLIIEIFFYLLVYCN